MLSHLATLRRLPHIRKYRCAITRPPHSPPPNLGCTGIPRMRPPHSRRRACNERRTACMQRAMRAPFPADVASDGARRRGDRRNRSHHRMHRNGRGCSKRPSLSPRTPGRRWSTIDVHHNDMRLTRRTRNTDCCPLSRNMHRQRAWWHLCENAAWPSRLRRPAQTPKPNPATSPAFTSAVQFARQLEGFAGPLLLPKQKGLHRFSS